MRSFLFATFCVVLGSGCATVKTHPYKPQSMTVSAVKPALYDAVANLARAQGWEIVVTEPGQGFVEAIAPAETTLGMNMRERWRFDVRDYEIGVTRLLEVQFDRDGGEWLREGAVHVGYTYQREQEVLASLGAKFGATIPYFD